VEDYETMNNELKSYSEELYGKPQIVAANKIDITEAVERLKELKEYCDKLEITLFPISSATGEGLEELKWGIVKLLDNIRIQDLAEPSD